METGQWFTEAICTFLEASGTAFGDIMNPSMKTVRYSFTTVIEKRKASFKRTVTDLVIAEESGVKQKLIDGMILEMEENLEMKRAEKMEQTEQ